MRDREPFASRGKSAPIDDDMKMRMRPVGVEGGHIVPFGTVRPGGLRGEHFRIRARPCDAVAPKAEHGFGPGPPGGMGILFLGAGRKTDDDMASSDPDDRRSAACRGFTCRFAPPRRGRGSRTRPTSITPPPYRSDSPQLDVNPSGSDRSTGCRCGKWSDTAAL